MITPSMSDSVEDLAARSTKLMQAYTSYAPAIDINEGACLLCRICMIPP